MASLQLAACAEEQVSRPGTGADPVGVDDGGAPPQADGSSADAAGADESAYAAFLYGADRAYATGAGSFPEQADTTNAFYVGLFLMPDHRFRLFYAEGSGTVSAFGHSLALFGDRQFARSGAWRVEDGALRVGEYLECFPSTINDQPGLYCGLEAAIGHAAAVGRSASLTRSLAGSPDDSTWAEYR